jgi:hypothetical protein
MFRLTSCLLLCGVTLAFAQPAPTLAVAETVTPTGSVTERQRCAAAAVVQIPSHGASGSIIHTEPGRTLILSCAHGFTGRDSRGRPLRDVPLTLQVPSATAPVGTKHAAIRLLALGRPDADDLALLELADGPLPWVCPVAPRGHLVAGCALSVGYDDMRWPATQRAATILTGLTQTRERPWHGRSGGALIDPVGYLVGVCHGYTGPRTRQEVVRGGQGLYVSHGTIVQFLDRAGYGWLAVGAAPAFPAPLPQAGREGGPHPDQLRHQIAILQQQLAILQRQVELLQGGYAPAPTAPQQKAMPYGPCTPQALPPCRH